MIPVEMISEKEMLRLFPKPRRHLNLLLCALITGNVYLTVQLPSESSSAYLMSSEALK
jgi:hypothetical protein